MPEAPPLWSPKSLAAQGVSSAKSGSRAPSGVLLLRHQTPADHQPCQTPKPGRLGAAPPGERQGISPDSGRDPTGSKLSADPEKPEDRLQTQLLANSRTYSPLGVQPRGELPTPLASSRAQQASRLLLMLGVRILCVCGSRRGVWKVTCGGGSAAQPCVSTPPRQAARPGPRSPRKLAQ